MSVLRTLLGTEQRDLNLTLDQEPAPAADPAGDGSALGLLHYQGVGGVEWQGGNGGPLAFPAVLASIRVIAETVGTLPLPVYRRTGDGGRTRLTVDDDPRVALLAEPNPDQDSVEFWETVVALLLQRGRAHIRIAKRDRFGLPSELRVLDPRGVRLRRADDGTRFWQLGWDDRTALRMDLPDVIPLSAFGGLSPIGVCRQAIQLGLTAQQYGTRLWSNDTRPGSYLATEKELTDAAYLRMRAQFEERHQGVNNAGRLAILEGGVKWQDVGIPPEDAQFIETRKFQVTEVARMFRLPPHKIGDLERATFSNIEHQSIEYVQDSILPWCVRIERRLQRGLFGLYGDRDIFPEFLLDGLLRGDTATRYAAYAAAPWMSDNEKRQREGLAKLPGLDATYAPLNMTRVLDGQVVPTTPEGEQDPTWQKVGLPALVDGGIVSAAWAAEQVGAPTDGLSTVPQVRLDPALGGQQ